MKPNQKCFFKTLFVLSLLTIGLLTATESHQTQELTIAQANLLVGGWDWGKFGTGIICGGGIVGIAGGMLSGIGTAGAVFAVSSVVGACVSMF